MTNLVLEQDEKRLETAEVGRSFVARAESRTSITMTNDDLDDVSSIMSEIKEADKLVAEEKEATVAANKLDEDLAKLETKIESHKKV